MDESIEVKLAALTQKVDTHDKEIDELKKDRSVIIRVEAKQDYIIGTINDLKKSIENLSGSQASNTQLENKTWSPIVMALIKLLGTAITVIGTAFGVVKLTGN